MEGYLFDKQFLLALDNYPTREVYVRITSLDKEENPVESIEGRATGGSINIDGASALRRTCSLSMVAKNVQLTDYYWTLNTKFKLEIGLFNFATKYPDIDHPEWSSYPTICWFKQGIYLITSFSQSLNTGSYNISISGKDKMACLNGECGGTLTSSVDFGKTEYYDKNTNSSFYEFTPIKDIIYNAVHLYGEELTHKIIINDLDIMGKQLMEYRGEDPLYLITSATTGEVVQAILDGDLECYMCDVDGRSLLNDGKAIKISEIPIYSLGEEYINTAAQLQRTPTIVNFAKSKNSQGIYYTYVVQKVLYGQAVGYEEVPLTYTSKDSKTDLIGNVGESITSILDKIKAMLGDYEYFYDLDGNFIFQKQQIYTNVSWADMINNGDGVFISDIAYGTSTEYDFYNSKLFTAISSNPKIENIKNDYSIWGTKKTITGSSVPIHMRYAIDKKPEQYTTITVTAEEIENLLISKYELPINYFNYNDGTINDEGEYIVTLANDFQYHMKPREKSTTYIAYTPTILNRQRAMQYLEEDSPALIDLVRKHPYNESTGSKLSNTSGSLAVKWQALTNTRMQIAKENNWDLAMANQYILLFKLWDSCYGDYAIETNQATNSKLDLALSKLLVPSKERLSLEELSLIQSEFKNHFGEDLIDFGYNTIDSPIKYVDWREIIYQMAKDFYAYNELDNFNWKILEANGTLYPRGITGYERYYIDIDGFWRDLYWGWDEDLEPTIKDILVQQVRPANRELVKDEDIFVRSKMKPILAKDLIEQLDQEIGAIYKQEKWTTSEDIRKNIFTTSIIDMKLATNTNNDSNYNYIDMTITPTTNEKIELIQIKYDGAQLREDTVNFRSSFTSDLEIESSNSAFSFSKKAQNATGVIWLNPISNVPEGLYTITINPLAGYWESYIIIRLTIAHNAIVPTLPTGVSQLDYYIYEHNPSGGYSSFIPWWQYDVQMQINIKDYLQNNESADDSIAAGQEKIYFPYEEHSGFSINELSGKMIEWIENGGHCHDLMFLFFATLRRRKVLNGNPDDTTDKYSIFATRQFEDLFVLWDEYGSAEAKSVIKSKVAYEISLANAIADGTVSTLEKMDIKKSILREVQSLYRITFFEEYLNLLVTTPEIISLTQDELGVYTRPEKYVAIIYQIIGHLESNSTSDPNARNKMKSDLQQLLEEYRESGASTDEVIRISNLAILWIMWYDEPEDSQKKKISMEARQLLIYGFYDNSIIDEKTFNKTYFDEFAVEYDGTSYFGIIDDNTDYSAAMLDYAKTIHAYVLDRNKPNEQNWKLMEDETFMNLAKARMTKVIKFSYSREAAEQLQNMYKMYDYYGIGSRDGISDGAGIILDYLMASKEERKARTMDNRISGWSTKYKEKTGVDFNAALENIDTWEKKNVENIDYSKEMIAYIQKNNASPDDEEWISLAQKRKNKVLILNYSYPAAIQFENLCVLYMEKKNSWSAQYLDIIFSILTGAYKSDEDVIHSRITY